MPKDYKELISELNNPDKKTRLDALKQIKNKIDSGDPSVEKSPQTNYVNNHIHTIYSFSPYSPTKAVYMAWAAGLKTAGIMDHDSIAGAEEFISAGEILGLATTIGLECRVNFKGTPFEGLKLNNPDQETCVYVAMHGIPHTKIKNVQDFFTPYRKFRNERNKLMSKKLGMDFEREVLPLSQYENGGTVTERHICYAYSLKLIEKYGKGKNLLDNLNIEIPEKVRLILLDENNPYYEYDLLGALKGGLVQSFYIPADAENPLLAEFIKFTHEICAISAYPYLGDITDSVTGDKKAQKFEDDYLDELIPFAVKTGFNSIAYMPTRNTLTQLERLQKLCRKYNLFEISGEDINTPRQSFICQALERPEFAHLTRATWALIGHEKAATQDIEKSMFGDWAIRKYPSIDERCDYYANYKIS